MIRIVAIRKALMAGIAGALISAFVAQLLAWLGLPLIDLVRVLGTLVAPGKPVWIWWPAGLVLHIAVGAIGAVFYAYFFYAFTPWRPIVQGLAFGSMAAVTVGVVGYPLHLLMHASGEVAHTNLMGFGHMLGWRERVGLLAQSSRLWGRARDTLHPSSRAQHRQASEPRAGYPPSQPRPRRETD